MTKRHTYHTSVREGLIGRHASRIADKFNETNTGSGRPAPDKIKKFVEEAGVQMNLLCAMIFNPEDYEVLNAVYGKGTDYFTRQDMHIQTRIAAIDDAHQLLQTMPDGPEKDAKTREIVSGLLNDTPLNADTLLRPDLLLAIKEDMSKEPKDDTKLNIMETIIKRVNDYNKDALAEGRQELDTNLVANWLWETSGFNPNFRTHEGIGMGNVSVNLLPTYGLTLEQMQQDPTAIGIDAAIAHLGRLTEQTGNQYLALAVHEGGESFDANGDGDYNDVGDRKSVLQQVADNLGIDVHDVRMHKHLADMKDQNVGFYDDVLAYNASYWDEDLKEQSRRLNREVLGYDAPGDSALRRSFANAAPLTTAPQQEEPKPAGPKEETAPT